MNIRIKNLMVATALMAFTTPAVSNLLEGLPITIDSSIDSDVGYMTRNRELKEEEVEDSATNDDNSHAVIDTEAKVVIRLNPDQFEKISAGMSAKMRLTGTGQGLEDRFNGDNGFLSLFDELSVDVGAQITNVGTVMLHTGKIDTGFGAHSDSPGQAKTIMSFYNDDLYDRSKRLAGVTGFKLVFDAKKLSQTPDPVRTKSKIDKMNQRLSAMEPNDLMRFLGKTSISFFNSGTAEVKSFFPDEDEDEYSAWNGFVISNENKLAVGNGISVGWKASWARHSDEFTDLGAALLTADTPTATEIATAAADDKVEEQADNEIDIALEACADLDQLSAMNLGLGVCVHGGYYKNMSDLEEQTATTLADVYRNPIDSAVRTGVSMDVMSTGTGVAFDYQNSKCHEENEGPSCVDSIWKTSITQAISESMNLGISYSKTSYESQDVAANTLEDDNRFFFTIGLRK